MMKNEPIATGKKAKDAGEIRADRSARRRDQRSTHSVTTPARQARSAPVKFDALHRAVDAEMRAGTDRRSDRRRR